MKRQISQVHGRLCNVKHKAKELLMPCEGFLEWNVWFFVKVTDMEKIHL